MIGQNLHFVGILGAGMNAVAQMALRRGLNVSGSDRRLDRGCDQAGGVADCLGSLGARLLPQDGSAIASADTVIVSSAIETGNPDLEAARTRQLPIVHRSRALADLLGPGRLIGVAGTSGKTTVTGMLGWILTALGMEPTVINGDALIDWRGFNRIGNTRFGSGPWQVVELDESDRSCLDYHPEWAVITNITPDHFKAAETVRLFRQFRSQVVRGAVGALDNDGREPSLPDRSGPVDFEFEGLSVRLRLPGRHNAVNARQCLELCRLLNCDLPGAVKALGLFNGIARRLELVDAPANGPAVYDDFAHNPAKIAAAISAVRPEHGRLAAVWQPHGFNPLRQMFAALTAAFEALLRPRDRLLLLPVYYAGGTTRRTLTSEDLAAALRKRQIRATAVTGWPALKSDLAAMKLTGADVVLMMGARDPALPQRIRETIAGLLQAV